jgi:ABC-type sugar transport system ATPase subunit
MIYVTHDQLEAIALANRIAIMDFGKLQQFDTPDAIYSHPADLFVARFIGNPPSNVIDGEVVRRGDSYIFQNRNFELDISMYGNLIRDKLTSERLAISFHAEDLAIKSPTDSEDAIPSTVYAVELLGYDQILDLKIDDFIVRAVVPSSFVVKTDEQICFNVAVEKINLYDKKSGKNLLFLAD